MNVPMYKVFTSIPTYMHGSYGCLPTYLRYVVLVKYLDVMIHLN